MNADEPKTTPETDNYAALGDFWDTHSLADYWDQTEAVEMDFEPAQHRTLVSVDPDLLLRVQRAARARGLSTESLVNLMLEQRLQQLAPNAPAAP